MGSSHGHRYGRGARYFTEGLLAVWYGEQAILFIRENGAAVSLGIVTVLVVAFVAYLFWRKAVPATRP